MVKIPDNKDGMFSAWCNNKAAFKEIEHVFLYPNEFSQYCIVCLPLGKHTVQCYDDSFGP